MLVSNADNGLDTKARVDTDRADDSDDITFGLILTMLEGRMEVQKVLCDAIGVNARMKYFLEICFDVNDNMVNDNIIKQ